MKVFTLYQLLQVPQDCTFDELRRAFRERAKECHPDLHGGDPIMTARFQEVVNAFDVLSDPDSRRDYDSRLAYDSNSPVVPGHRDSAVMDTVADDILEELVVGNDAPRNTTLQNLMLDLERTERFIMFRQARNLFDQSAWNLCLKICEKLVDLSPGNILYHFYLAESANRLGHNRKALRHYKLCLDLGRNRSPQQRLARVRRHYRRLQQKRGWFGKFLAWMMGDDPPENLSDEEKSRLILEETFASADKKHRKKPLPEQQPRRKRLLRPPSE